MMFTEIKKKPTGNHGNGIILNLVIGDAFGQPYIRYADVLLMYAEALNGSGSLTRQMRCYYSLVRSRAKVFQMR